MIENRKIPLILICGFLGSGKTTLVNRLLEEGFGGERTAVVVNDFGSVAIDQALIDHDEKGMLVLTNGCICCSLASDLVLGLKEMLETGRYDRIVMETSGVTAVASLRQALQWPAIATLLEIERVITVVDALRFTRIQQVVRVAAEQVANAELIVLNYYEDAKPEQRQKTEEALRAINPRAPIIKTSHCQVTRTELDIKPLRGLGRPGFNKDDQQTDQAAEMNDHWFTCRLLFAEPMAGAVLESMLQAIPATVHRIKGFVRESADRVLHIQRAGDSLNIEPWHGAIPAESMGTLVTISSSPIEKELTEIFENLKSVKIVSDDDLHAHQHHHHG